LILTEKANILESA